MNAANEERRRPRHRVAAAQKMGHRQASHRYEYPTCPPIRRPTAPSTFGLTDGELWAEAARLVCVWGFSLDQVREVLLLPESVIA